VIPNLEYTPEEDKKEIRSADNASSGCIDCKIILIF